MKRRSSKRNRKVARGDCDLSVEETQENNLARGDAVAQNLPEWLEEFTEILIVREGSVQEPSSSQELSILELRSRVKTGMRPILRRMQKDKNDKGTLQKARW